eukprot:gnl/Spiro4/6077_TR3116_c1_g1_i1.p1 gnl/Spiro4/6077_TR3116_c1_g1~~gnl/Spiro4/6077_TR3116_c1_g1_i1.p1  ORF type:complete len:124 (+),score=23.68 gnl/Spiro4/6077_TR3116_c1_g1_i1:54-425(+)
MSNWKRSFIRRFTRFHVDIPPYGENTTARELIMRMKSWRTENAGPETIITQAWLLDRTKGARILMEWRKGPVEKMEIGNLNLEEVYQALDYRYQQLDLEYFKETGSGMEYDADEEDEELDAER